MAKFDEQIERPMPECPHCHEDRQIERMGDDWLCNTCSKTFPALSVNDKRFLKQIRIVPED